jgi:hypothetical protein
MDPVDWAWTKQGSKMELKNRTATPRYERRTRAPYLKAFKCSRLDLYASTNIVVNQKFAAKNSLPSLHRRIREDSKPASGAPLAIALSRSSSNRRGNHHLLSPLPA